MKVQSSYSFKIIYRVGRECGSPRDTHRCPNTVLPGWETEWTSAAGHASGWRPCTVEREDIKIYSLINTELSYIVELRINNMRPLRGVFFTSGVRTLRWQTMAGTDMMWMRNDLSRFSEKWAAMTGLKNIRVCSKDGLQIKPHEDKANSVLITGFHLTLMTKWRQRSECLWRETV